MAERRLLASMNLGYPGVLAYTPQENLEDGPGLLEASRFTSSFPHFNIIGPLNTLYPPSKTRLPEASSKLWRERQTQERWLLNSHPGVFMGNTAFQDVLKDDMEHFKISEAVANDRPLLAIGHVPDLGDKSRARVLSVMAVASGESGECLRLARMDDTQWQWGKSKDAFLNVSAVDPAKKQEEVIWASDGLPILQIKFAGDRLQNDILRWLLVQKQTSTTILRPEYRQILGTTDRPKNVDLQQQPSFINPNPLLTIHHRQTGGSAHSDVALLPAASGRSTQVAIIDECGYWSVWDVLGAWQVRNKNNARLSLNKCGHICDGLLDGVPPHPSYPAQKHGMLVVGWTGAEQLRNDVAPSWHLLVWNRERIEVLDLESNTSLPRLAPLLTRKGKPDWILDIQCSPVRENHVFVLTKHYIIWIDAFSYHASRESPPRPSILLTCPHLGTKHDDSKMFVCQASDDDADTSLIFIHYPKRRQLCIYWFTFTPGSKIPQWHRDIISLPGSDEFHVRNSIQLLRVDLVKLAASIKDNALSPGIKYHQRGARFYQLSLLGDDLSLQHCVCAISRDPTLEIIYPTTRVAWAEARLQRQREKKRRRLMGHISDTFVLPDGMTTDDIETLLKQNKNSMEVPEFRQLQDGGPRGPQPVHLKVDSLCRALRNSLRKSIHRGERGLPPQLFDVLQQTLNEGLDSGRLPLFTWGELAEELVDSSEYEPADDGMEEAIESFFDENNDKTIITQLRRYKVNETPTSLVGFPYLRHCFSELWLKPVEKLLSLEMQRVRQIWISELARDAFLSNYGIMVQDTPLLGPAGSEAVESSQGFPPSSQLPRSSRSGSWAIESSPARSVVSTTTDGAIQRLQLLAPSLCPKKLDASKQCKVLSYWPTERGVDTSEYVSSIAIANDELFRGARERLHKIEAKRKARAEKYKRPAFMRQGLPDSEPARRPPVPAPAQILSSQAVPDSSQNQGVFGRPSVTMSQPMPGAFGDRKKAKKGRRKSGFR